jgi:hypothetical protein
VCVHAHACVRAEYAHTCAQTCMPTHKRNEGPGRRDKTRMRTFSLARPGTKHNDHPVSEDDEAQGDGDDAGGRSAEIGQ